MEANTFEGVLLIRKLMSPVHICYGRLYNRARLMINYVRVLCCTEIWVDGIS